MAAIFLKAVTKLMKYYITDSYGGNFAALADNNCLLSLNIQL
jgi:hypothetical protein